MSDFQNQAISTEFSASREIGPKHVDFETDMAMEVNIGAAARLARVSHDDIHRAMVSGVLPHHRDQDGRHVATLGDLLAWMRAQLVARHGQ
jgi:hypothetical protein